MSRLVVPATPDALGVIAAFIWAAAADAQLRHQTAYHLRLAVDELTTNIIQHAQTGGATVNIRIVVETSTDSVRVTIEDSAPPFDPTQAPAPADIGLPPIQRAVGGLGIHLARHSVDHMEHHYEDGRNVNVLTVIR